MAHEPTRGALRPKAFCARYGIGETKFYAELKAGKLKAKKSGGVLLITEDAAEEWLRSLPAYQARTS